MDDIKKLIQEQLAKDQTRGGDKKFCAIFTSVVRPAVIKILEAAGFIKIGGYHSHRHARAVSVMMIRPTSKLEWDSGKAAFPKKQARKKK